MPEHEKSEPSNPLLVSVEGEQQRIEEKDHNAELAAAQTIPDAAGCIPASGSLEFVQAANVTLSTENAQLRQALRVIRKGLSDDTDGEFWPARQWLDRRDIFHGDLSGNRVLELVAKHALHGNLAMPSIGAGLKTIEFLWNNGDFDGLIGFVRELLAAAKPSTEVSSATAASPAQKNPTDTSALQARQDRRDPGWQSMETAPKDGTPVLGWCVSVGGVNGRPETISWRDAYGGSWWDWNTEYTLNPTHWMPLPSPPKETT